MKKYIGTDADIEKGSNATLSHHISSVNQLAHFISICYRIDMDLAVFHIDWNVVGLSDLKNEILEREQNFTAGILNNYENGLLYIYD